MEVKAKEIEPTDIKLGDIFSSVSEKDFYILVKTSEQMYEAISLTGVGVWSYSDELDEIKRLLKDSVDQNRLIHYSSDIYRLMIDKI